MHKHSTNIPCSFEDCFIRVYIVLLDSASVFYVHMAFMPIKPLKIEESVLQLVV